MRFWTKPTSSDTAMWLMTFTPAEEQEAADNNYSPCTREHLPTVWRMARNFASMQSPHISTLDGRTAETHKL